ncbi:MAG: cytochrome b N-terminal domain-containing protein [Desulfobacteraceae bacterium]|nr:cytochrome b N-terminal domain-containing protein [Desulfobacteraceae bacterium]MDH3566763.1 cytochrome b N-terminal domain-containing protein [Desulfobacteraceae bacterium]
MKPLQRQSSETSGYFHRIFQSIFPDPIIPKSDQERKRYLIKNLILHFRPATVPEKTLKFSLTWGLGGMAAVLIFLQLGTGLLLKFIYVPTPVGAYKSILALNNEVMFGQLIRNIHHWCANFLVLIVFLHMLRAFFTGAFHPPRQFTWIIGLGLFGLVLAANFTGYLLPYDQLAYWAVTVSTGMLEYIPFIGGRLQEIIQGGNEIGPATLSMFFAIHTAVVPLGLILLMAFHFWRIRKSRGLVIPRAPGEEIEEKPVRVPTVPHLLLRELVVALVLVAVVMVVSVSFDVPLGNSANPGLSPNPTKAPWYFSGLQELLLHLHPLFTVFIIPLVLVVALMGIPYLKYDTNTEGIWFASVKGRKISLISALIAIVVAPLGILVNEYLFDFVPGLHGIPAIIGNGLIPFSLIFLGCAGFYILIKHRYFGTTNEAVQAIFVLILFVFLILTTTGIWFRGPGMKLIWPF